MLVLDIALVIALTLPLRAMLLRPLNTVLVSANNVAEDDLIEELAFQQRDEIGALAAAFQSNDIS